MNKKCGNCSFHSDKCKNPDNKNYNQYRDKEDRCSGCKVEDTCLIKEENKTWLRGGVHG